jgi:TatD DNase family protein
LEYKFTDSHAHLSSSEVAEKADDMIVRAQKQSVQTIINVCTDKKSLEDGLLLQEKWEGVYCAAAVPPHDCEKDYEEDFALITKSSFNGDLVAIGETGLDFYYKDLPKEKQYACLKRHLDLAKEADLPVVFHCREAFSDLFKFCDDHFPKLRAAIHCFTGNKEEALEAVKRGWYISYSGIVTFKKSVELRETIKCIPLSHIFIETDTPYLAPQSKRGKQNEPSFLPETAQVIAEEKGIDISEVARATSENARKFFSIEALT